MITLYESGGFAIKFENGIIVSVQFSDCHYCDKPKLLNDVIIVENAELAIFFEAKPRVWLTRQFANYVLSQTITDDVIPYATSNIVAQAMAWAEEY